MIHFDLPWALLALFLLPLMVIFSLRKKRFISFPSLRPMLSIPRHWSEGLRFMPLLLRVLAVGLVVIALSRPQIQSFLQEHLSEGLDIVLVIDTSKSMEARDFLLEGSRPTRLDVVKKVIFDFIKERPSDRIGVVIFGSEAFTQAPLTLDHDILLNFLKKVQIGMAGDATAIGDGLATAVNRLKKLEAKSKIVILLTDGANTAGRIDPLAAADAALTKKVTVYTIGVGSLPTTPNQGGKQAAGSPLEVDETLLKDIANRTGGKYFLATNTEALAKVYEQIDLLEKTKAKIKSFSQYQELFPWFLIGALICLVGECLFGLSRMRSVP